MQATNNSVQINDVIAVGGLTAMRVDDDLSWGEGSILPQAEYESAADQQKLTEVVLSCIEPVAADETAYSSCTDGRIPVALANGEPIPVREQMVGADMVSAFYVAEVLGAHFYKDPAAPVAQRVREVADFLRENGLKPSSHIGCGAGAGFAVIMANVQRFAADPRYAARLRALLPEGVYDAGLRTQMLAEVKERLEANRYEGLAAQTFLDAVAEVSGDRAIAELKDDNRGVHGHVEEQIIRVRVPGKAINEAKVAALTGGREVFGVNDLRMDKIARLFARGRSDADYRKARMALEDFASGGHGTLAKNLPTWIVTEAWPSEA